MSAQNFVLSSTTVQAGIGIFVDGSALYPDYKQSAALCYSWNFGDGCGIADPTNYADGAKVDVGAAYPGRTAAHRYLHSGAYTIQLVVSQRNDDGSPGKFLAVFAQRVVVLPSTRTVYYVDGAKGSDANPGIDPAKPWKTADHAFGTLTAKSLIEIEFAPDQVYPITKPATFVSKSQHDVVIGVPWASPVKQATLFAPSAINLFALGEIQNVTIQGLILDSAIDAGAQEVGEGGLPGCQPGVATVGVMDASCLTIADCSLGRLSDGIHAAGAVNGLLVLRCLQLYPQGITNYPLWLSCQSGAVVGCRFLGSNWQPCARADGDGSLSLGVGKLSIVYSYFQQVRNAAGDGNAKEPLTIRDGSLIDIHRCMVFDGLLHLNAPGVTEPGEQSATVDQVDARHNLVVGINAAGGLEVLAGVTNSAILDNQSIQRFGACFRVTATAAGTPSTANLIHLHNQPFATAAGVAGLVVEGPLPAGFVTDVAMPAATIQGAAAGIRTPAPMFTGKMPAIAPAGGA